LQEFLKACHAIQPSVERGAIDKPARDELFYMIASCVETLAEDRIDRLFDSQYRARLAEIRKANELAENQFWKADDPAIPEEYKEILHEFKARKRDLLCAAFRDYGQPETATLVIEDYAAYQERKMAGRQIYLARDPLDPFLGRILSEDAGEDVEDKPEEED
jgi:hypothetical protein